MAKKFPIRPAHPERNCWGCDKYCSSDSMICGNGSERTQHPVELLGEDWAAWGFDPPSNTPEDAAQPDGCGSDAAGEPACEASSPLVLSLKAED